MGRSDPKIRIGRVVIQAGADELWFHASFFSFFRSILVVLNIIVLLAVSGVISSSSCDNGETATTGYFAVSLGLTLAITLNYFWIRTISMRGDIFENEKRSRIKLSL